jgi:hypothetical protein
MADSVDVSSTTTPSAPVARSQALTGLERAVQVIQAVLHLTCVVLIAYKFLVPGEHRLPVVAFWFPAMSVFPSANIDWITKWPNLARVFLPLGFGLLGAVLLLGLLVDWQLGAVLVPLALMFVLMGWGFRLRLAEPPGAPITLPRFRVGVAALSCGALWLALVAQL